MRVEQKAYLSAEINSKEYLEGRLSELRGEIKDIETYERYLSALRTALANGATPDDLRDKLYSELDPAWAEKRREVDEIFKNLSDSEEENEREAAKNRLKELMDEIKMDDIVKMGKAYTFAVTVLQRNEIEPGQVGDRLNDPILRIEVDPKEYEGHKMLKQTFFVDFGKNYELYIDEFSAPLYDELDEEFEEGYPEEFFKIRAMGILIESLVSKPSAGKIDMDAFAERCAFDLEKEGNILSIDGTNAAEEIARVLEKNGIVKVKGDTIKWKV